VAVVLLLAADSLISDRFNAGLSLVGGRSDTPTYLAWGRAHFFLALIVVPCLLGYVLCKWAITAPSNTISGFGLFLGGWALQWVISGSLGCRDG